jgi:hypothetical protein
MAIASTAHASFLAVDFKEVLSIMAAIFGFFVNCDAHDCDLHSLWPERDFSGSL